MRNHLLYILGGILVLAACSKDKGNYDYISVPDPVISGLDTAYNATSGDSLIIAPVITLRSGKNDYSCTWKISVPERAMSVDYEGQQLRIVFGLGANRYNALLIVTDNNTKQKYYYEFVVKGQTQFTRGTLVLSNDNNRTVLSFVKPDGTLQPDIYTAINNSGIPGGAMQIVPVRNQFYMNQLNYFWVTYSGEGTGAIQVDANTLLKAKTLEENFYTAPPAREVSTFLNMPAGVTTAIINGKLFLGATETAPFWPYYGFWGEPIGGDYQLHPRIITNAYEQPNAGYYLGFEKRKKQFVRFSLSNFYDTTYTVTDSLFNPKKLGMDLLYMERFSDNSIYAFVDSVGKKIELRFSVDWSEDRSRFGALGKREFPGAALLTAGTLWQSSPVGVFFFTSNDKIYRYNPLNKEVKALDASFGGKRITMLRMTNNGNQLIAGVEGAVYYLNTSTGNNGAIVSKTEGIPGEPVDIMIREN